jgi:hypothetical protein
MLGQRSPGGIVSPLGVSLLRDVSSLDETSPDRLVNSGTFLTWKVNLKLEFL